MRLLLLFGCALVALGAAGDYLRDSVSPRMTAWATEMRSAQERLVHDQVGFAMGDVSEEQLDADRRHLSEVSQRGGMLGVLASN